MKIQFLSIQMIMFTSFFLPCEIEIFNKQKNFTFLFLQSFIHILDLQATD